MRSRRWWRRPATSSPARRRATSCSASLRLLIAIGAGRARVRGKRLLPLHVDQHRADLADGDRDLESNLANRFGLPERGRRGAQFVEERFEPADRLVVFVLGALHLAAVTPPCAPRARLRDEREAGDRALEGLELDDFSSAPPHGLLAGQESRPGHFDPLAVVGA